MAAYYRALRRWVLLNVIIVGLGGFVGSVLRYLLGTFVQRVSDSQTFPYGTLTVNLLGCLLIGFIVGLIDHRGGFSTQARLFLLIGVLGGFTTFSTFGFDTFNLIRSQHIGLALANASVQVVVGVFAVWAGYMLSNLPS